MSNTLLNEDFINKIIKAWDKETCWRIIKLIQERINFLHDKQDLTDVEEDEWYELHIYKHELQKIIKWVKEKIFNTL